MSCIDVRRGTDVNRSASFEGGICVVPKMHEQERVIWIAAQQLVVDSLVVDPFYRENKLYGVRGIRQHTNSFFECMSKQQRHSSAVTSYVTRSCVNCLEVEDTAIPRTLP